MNYLRKAEERGHARFSWLDSKHSFSFGHYYDPRHMGFSVLRVINDDTVLPGAGFDTHGHRDMEIISYILEGSIEHRDSEGNVHTITAGEVQRMSAGTGIRHSEFNHSSTDALRFLQIWIQPKIMGLKPSYEQKPVEQTETLTELVTPTGTNGSLSINQDIRLSRLVLDKNESFSIPITDGRLSYLHIIEGELVVNGDLMLKPGDGLGTDAQALDLKAESGVTALFFDLPSV